MFTETKRREETETRPEDKLTDSAVPVLPNVEETVSFVRTDCRKEAAAYLEETEVRHGGE